MFVLVCLSWGAFTTVVAESYAMITVVMQVKIFHAVTNFPTDFALGFPGFFVFLFQ